MVGGLGPVVGKAGEKKKADTSDGRICDGDERVLDGSCFRKLREGISSSKIVDFSSLSLVSPSSQPPKCSSLGWSVKGTYRTPMILTPRTFPCASF